MYPEVEQFIAATEAADAAWAASGNAAQDTFDAKAEEAGVYRHVFSGPCPRCDFDSGPAGDEKKAAVKAADEVHRAAKKAAWDALKASSDPLVTWIAENARNYKYEATMVLAALPADMDTLDAMADKCGWCGAWRTMRARADLAGVLPTGSEVSA